MTHQRMCTILCYVKQPGSFGKRKGPLIFPSHERNSNGEANLKSVITDQSVMRNPLYYNPWKRVRRANLL